MHQLNAVSNADFTAPGNHFILTLNSGNFKSNIWIIDSGATNLVCNNKDMFTNMKKVNNTRIRLQNKSVLKVDKVGDIQLNDDWY